MEIVFDKMRAEFGCKKTPHLYSIDGGLSFAGFFSFASSNGSFTVDYMKQLGKTPDFNKRSVGEFIDWLIVNHWGEEEQQAEAA